MKKFLKLVIVGTTLANLILASGYVAYAETLVNNNVEYEDLYGEETNSSTEAETETKSNTSGEITSENSGLKSLYGDVEADMNKAGDSGTLESVREGTAGLSSTIPQMVIILAPRIIIVYFALEFLMLIFPPLHTLLTKVAGKNGGASSGGMGGSEDRLWFITQDFYAAREFTGTGDNGGSAALWSKVSYLFQLKVKLLITCTLVMLVLLTPIGMKFVILLSDGVILILDKLFGAISGAIN